MITEWIDYLGQLSPFPYYINHFFIAIIISIVTNFIASRIFENKHNLFLLSGGVFYIVREGIQWAESGFTHFDYQGFWWPVFATFLLMLLFSSWTYRK